MAWGGEYADMYRCVYRHKRIVVYRYEYISRELYVDKGVGLEILKHILRCHAQCRVQESTHCRF